MSQHHAAFAKPMLSLSNVNVRFGEHVVIEAATAAFEAGTLTALVGPNGAGKTTLFNVISGQLRATSGNIILEEQEVQRLPPSRRTRLGIGRIFQLSQLFAESTVLENVNLAVQAHRRRGHDFWSKASAGVDLREASQHILDEVGLQNPHQLVSSLAHCDKRKLEFALMLAADPKVLLLDEPTAGMSVDDVSIVTALINKLRQSRERAILLVEHKLSVVRDLADRVLVLNNGKIIADGSPIEVMQSPEVRAAYFGAA